MSTVKLDNVVKIYDNGFKAVKEVNLDIKDKEFVVLVGPSGCGKSTILRMIAGLEEITSGTIRIGDEVVNDISAKDRDISMVFQSYALYPHMTVKDNIAFPLKMKKVPKSEIDKKVNEMAKLLQLEKFLDNKPVQLSGGQRQRVALGRAMVRDPKVFLLDEPLSNLDAKLRVEMRSEIVNLHKQSDRTFIYVTHDQTEAMTMGDRIAVLNAGILEQFDTPLNLYYKPENRFVAEFIGTPKMNVIKTSFYKEEDKLFLRLFDSSIEIPKEIINHYGSIKPDKDYYIGIRSESFFWDEKSGIDITFSNIEYMGSDIFAYVKTSGTEDDVVMRFDSEDNIDFGTNGKVSIDLSKLYIFDSDTEKTILCPLN